MLKIKSGLKESSHVIEKICVYKPELNIYPYLYENRIEIAKYHIESTDIRSDFFHRTMNKKILVC